MGASLAWTGALLQVAAKACVLARGSLALWVRARSPAPVREVSTGRSGPSRGAVEAVANGRRGRTSASDRTGGLMILLLAHVPLDDVDKALEARG